MKWKTKDQIKDEKAQIEGKKAEKQKLKGKSFTTISAKEKDALLEQIAKDLGYL